MGQQAQVYFGDNMHRSRKHMTGMRGKVVVGKGRRGAKKQLPERFEQAIDRAAMKIGAADTDAYLAEWRRHRRTLDGDLTEAADAEIARLESLYTDEKLHQLIRAKGVDESREVT